MATLGHADEGQGARERALERWATSFAALLLGLICLLVTVSVLGRWWGWALIPDEVLIARQLMIAVILLPLASVAARGMHIAVTIVTDRLSACCNAWLYRLGSALGLLVLVLLLWGGLKMLVASWHSEEIYDGFLRIPLWPGQAIYVAALAIAGVRMALEAVSPRPSEHDSQ